MRQWLAAISLLLLVNNPLHAQERRIAITFDDAPRSAGQLLSTEERTALLIRSLADANVDEAMFFVTTSNLQRAGKEGEARLRQFTSAGHTLANHSHNHVSANRIDGMAFISDFVESMRLLREFDRVAPFFRFPFLHEGNTTEKRDLIRAGISEAGLRAGYVTIDNYDWYLQALFTEALNDGRDIDLDAWREVYVDVLIDAVTFYDALAVDALGRSPSHVLLLHENELAALFIDDLCDALRALGWQIIPATDAYDDPIATREPDTLVLGQGRVAALAAERGFSFSELIHPLEDEANLRALLVAKGLVGTAKGAYLDQSPPGLRPQKFAPDSISLPDRYEYGSVFSSDGRELFFAVAVDGRGEIYQTRYRNGEWQSPTVILSDQEASYADPFLSRDAMRLYFISTRERPGATAGTNDIWYAKRQSDGWSAPIWAGPNVNTDGQDFYVSLTDNGTMAFATDTHSERQHDHDIYLAAPEANGWALPKRLEGRALTKAYEADPYIAPDGSYILFSSSRRSGLGMRDIYVTFRRDDNTWSKAIALGNGVNTPGLELCPSVTRDGKYLFYTSNEDIYWVSATVIDIARQKLASTDD